VAASPSAPLEVRRRRAAWWFLAPVLLVLAAVAAWPLLRTIWFGFTDARLGDLADASWIGTRNYLARAPDGGWSGLLADPLWWTSVRNTLVFTGLSVGLETVLGLVVALVLLRPFPGRGWVRAAVLVPWAIPTIVSAKLWGWILHDQFGLLNDLLMKAGVLDRPLAWTADPDLAMATVILVDVWKTTPFMALLMLAALQMLPRDCYEAARVDGIPPGPVFMHITLPLIAPALTVAVTFRALDALRIFDLVYVLTPNRPETMSMSVFARQQLVDFQSVGYGSAASTLLFATAALLAIVWLGFRRHHLQPGPR
jgi:trehalose/maltose transport system permease protein